MAVPQNVSFRFLDWNALRKDAKKYQIPLSRYVETLVAIGINTVQSTEGGTQLVVQNLLTPAVPEYYKQKNL